MLRTEGVAVTFGGVRAIDDLTLDVDAGVVTGLIGPNGAGKTTTFNVITGLNRPDRGRVVLDGVDVTRKGPRQRARMGLGRTFQRLEVFGSLSVRDNVLVALEARSGLRRGHADAADALLDRVGLTDVADTSADLLSTGTARMLELARALACAPKVLLLDEPSSGLDGAESTRLASLLRSLAADGIAVLLVEHDMELVMGLCSHLHVLDFGRLIASGDPASIRSSPTVQAAYLGASVEVGA